MDYLSEALFGFFTALIFVPFRGLGLFFVIYIILYEILKGLFTCSSAPCVQERTFVIFLTLVGRWIGELLWPLFLFFDRPLKM
jgi:hypothetical protein